MTAQFAEKLRYQEEGVAMLTTPLHDYFVMSGVYPRFESDSTALRRGYLGQWEIVDGRLYLLELRGTLEDGTAASLSTVFPGFPERVFAHWYSGTIRIPQGRQLKYVHQGYGSTFEQDLLLNIERGVVKDTRVRHNGTASESAPEGYQVAAMTVFPRAKKGNEEVE